MVQKSSVTWTLGLHIQKSSCTSWGAEGSGLYVYVLKKSNQSKTWNKDSAPECCIKNPPEMPGGVPGLSFFVIG